MSSLRELRDDLKRSTRAIERLIQQADCLREKLDLAKAKIDALEASNRLLLEKHGALGKLHREIKSERDDLAHQLGAEVATTQKLKARAERALAVAREHLAIADAHEAWCSAKGRCTYCDPINDVIAALTGEEH